MRSGGVVAKAEARRVVDAPVRCTVVGRTGPLLRLRASERLDVRIGESVLVDAVWADGSETIAADVIGLPGPGIVEVRTRGELSDRPKSVLLRRAATGARR